MKGMMLIDYNDMNLSLVLLMVMENHLGQLIGA
jgi:hypothetical protein